MLSSGSAFFFGLKPKSGVFPPLTMLLLLDPWRRHPADQVAGTLVVAKAAEEETDEGGPG